VPRPPPLGDVFSALLDSCVLVPSHLRDVLLETANPGVYRALWSEEILTELERTLGTLRDRRGIDGQETEAYVERLLRPMRTAFPDAVVGGWQPLVATFDLPDSNHRHVVAAAVAGRADVLVTQNLKHFPPDRLGPPPAGTGFGRVLAGRTRPASGRDARSASRRGRPTGWPGPARRSLPSRSSAGSGRRRYSPRQPLPHSPNPTAADLEDAPRQA